MIYTRHIFIALLFCGLFANCSVSQTNPSKPVQWPAITPVEPSGVSIQDGRFESTGGRFAIDIPSTPFQTLDYGSEKARAKGIDAGKQFAWRFETTLYTVMYSPAVDPDGNPTPQVYEDMIQGVRKGILRQNAKLISEKPSAFGEYRGTEFRYVSAQGVKFVGRIFLVGEVGYQIVGGYSEDKYEKEVLDVLDSFKLLSNKR